MIYIQKSNKNEPDSLRQTRSTQGATYDDCNKTDIRKALLLEQGYICAYCMRRIDESVNEKGQPNTRIEHYETQRTLPALQMNFMNMLAVCDGNEGNPRNLLHCDKRRTKNKALTIDPKNKNCKQLIKYGTSGVILSDNKVVENDLNKELNLNNQRFVNNRKKAIDMVILAIRKKYKKNKKGIWKKSDLEKELRNWNASQNNKLQEYCEAAIYYIERKISRS